jgi:cysteine-rich repeat protein
MWRGGLVLSILLTGCLGPETLQCPGGGVCPAGLVCRVDRGEQLCVLATCGNGVVEAGESCDDGNNDSGDVCAADCITPPTCGNGVIDFAEDCDDGNHVSGDGCQATCRFPIRPPARSGTAMTFDSSRGVLVLFGGGNTGWLDDTWEWNGIEWTERHPASPRPMARIRAAMTYDSVRERVLLFGGYDAMNTRLDDLWEWDGEMWRKIDVTPRPSPRGRTSMVFDTVRGVAVLFGGEVTTGDNDETWEWDGTAWTRRFPNTSPRPRADPVIAFDESQGRTILVGDRFEEATWMWNGNNWVEYSITSPNEFYGAGLAYDRARGRTVFVGGFTDSSLIWGGTWELVGAVWVDVSTDPHPPPREGFATSYVDPLGAVVVFGGVGRPTNGEFPLLDDLWSWDGTSWRERL